MQEYKVKWCTTPIRELSKHHLGCKGLEPKFIQLQVTARKQWRRSTGNAWGFSEWRMVCLGGEEPKINWFGLRSKKGRTLGGLSSERIDDFFDAFHNTGKNRDISFYEPTAFRRTKIHDQV